MSTPFVLPKEELKSPLQRTPGALLKFVQLYYCCSSIVRGIVLFILLSLLFVFCSSNFPGKASSIKEHVSEKTEYPSEEEYSW